MYTLLDYKASQSLSSDVTPASRFLWSTDVSIQLFFIYVSRRRRRHGTRTPFLSKAPYTSTLSSQWKIQRTRI